jgi:hypothetical protein
MMTFVDDEFSAHCDAGFMPTLAGAAFRRRFVEEARKNTSLPQRECEVTSLAGW